MGEKMKYQGGEMKYHGGGGPMGGGALPLSVEIDEIEESNPFQR